MSKSTLKLKNFNIFDLNSYYKTLNDDILQEEEDIIDITYESSPDNKNIFCYLILLSKGTLIYFEYSLITKKISNIFSNQALSMITNSLTCGELSFTAPIIVATSLNELIYVETTKKPCQMINATEDEIIIVSEPCDSKILKIKFNCEKNIICVICLNEIKIFKIGIDKTEGKTTLEYFNDIKFKNMSSLGIEFGLFYEKKFYFKFSNFYENNLIMAFVSEKPTSNDIVRLSVDNDEIDKNEKNQFLSLLMINLTKKDTPIKSLQCFAIDNNFIKIKFGCFFEKIFFLFENGIVCCLNSWVLNQEKNENIIINESQVNINLKNEKNSINNNLQPPQQENKNFIFSDKMIFKYPFNSAAVKFIDLYVHPSSHFIIVRDTENNFLIFDFTLNLYYILNNSKISVKMNMDNFSINEKVHCQAYKPYEINFFIKDKVNDNNTEMQIPQDEFKISKELRDFIVQGKFQNNAMFFFNNRIITTIIIDITGLFNSKDKLNPIIDEYQLLKNHLRGQNFDSAFKILMLLTDFQQWLNSLVLITNKICQKPSNILLIKKSSLAQALIYLTNKTFDDEEKQQAINTIRNSCFTNIVLRCLHVRQYEYAYLIIDKLGLSHLLKTLVAHSKLTQYLGINYLACTKLEENSEKEDNIINELNKIIANTNFTLSQNKLQLLIKDIDELIESDGLNTNYLKEYNSLEINLQKYYNGLSMEMEGRFDEAKELYKQNGLNYDYARVDKLNKELINQISEDSILELHDVEIENEINNINKKKEENKKDLFNNKKKSETISYSNNLNKNK